MKCQTHGPLFSIWNKLKPRESKRSTEVYACPEVDGTVSIMVLVPDYLTRHEQELIVSELHEIEDDRPYQEGGWIPMKGMFQTANETLRLNRWHQDEGRPYKFSGKLHQPIPPTPELAALQTRLNSKLKVAIAKTKHLFPHSVTWRKLNSVLVNKYRSEKDRLSFHTDDEVEFGPQPTIVSVSLGFPRTFTVKRMTNKMRQNYWTGAKAKQRRRTREFIEDPDYKREQYQFQLGAGDLMIMAGSMQEFWEHGVLKEEKKNKAEDIRPAFRYNLTFRSYTDTEDKSLWPATVTWLPPKRKPKPRAKPKPRTKSRTKAKASTKKKSTKKD